MENNQQSFWQFSDQLRIQNSNLANLSLNDSIWSNSYASKRPADERRNFDIRVGGELKYNYNTTTDLANNPNSVNSVTANPISKPKVSDFNGFNNDWKIGSGIASPDLNSINNNYNGWKLGSSDLGLIGQAIGSSTPKNIGYSKGFYSTKSNYNLNNNLNVNVKSYGKNKVGDEDHVNLKVNKKNSNKKNNNNNGDDGKDNNKNGTDKRFKTLPPSESLPKNETVGGYIFVCNNDTMQENLKRELFGLPPRYRDSVRQITPGLPLFLYNYSTHQLHGIFEAASFGGTNIDPTAWEDKKCIGESRFPAQVRVLTRKICEPLEEDSFRPILHHYDGPKFRLELNIPEALSLLDIFEEQDA